MNVTRNTAKLSGHKRFFGTPCLKGHTGERYTSNNRCVRCTQDAVNVLRSTPEGRKKSNEITSRSNAKHRLRVARTNRKYRGLPEARYPAPELCELCEQSNGSRGMCLDHDHKTGKFRGWLCLKCNTAIGKLGDNIAGLQRAIDYLQRSEAIV